MVNEHIITAVLSAIVAIMGKEFWSFWKNRDIIKGQVDTLSKIKKLEKEYNLKIKQIEKGYTNKISELEDEIHQLESERDQTNTAIRMMLTIFEGQYGENPTYQKVIEEVKKYLTPSSKKDKTKKQ